MEWNSWLKHVVKLPTMCKIKDSWQREFYHVSPSPPPGRRWMGMWIPPGSIDTHHDRFSQAGLWYGKIFSPSPLKSNSLKPQITLSLSNATVPLLTLVFVRRFPTSCFVNDFAVESLPRLFANFEAPCFAVFPVGLKNDRISCRKICSYGWNTGYKTITGNEND